MEAEAKYFASRLIIMSDILRGRCRYLFIQEKYKIYSWIRSENANHESVLRDVAERGRDIEGCIKQWFAFVKPNFEKFVEPQRKVAGKCCLFFYGLC